MEGDSIRSSFKAKMAAKRLKSLFVSVCNHSMDFNTSYSITYAIFVPVFKFIINFVFIYNLNIISIILNRNNC